MIDGTIYDSGKPGKNLLLLGAIHGNEPCGPLAIQKIMKEINEGTLSLLSGKLICIPVCNPEAYKQNKRLVEENLNRAFKPGWKPKTYEGKLAQEIRPWIEQADYVLDIHSLSGGTDRFLFKSDEEDDDVAEFAKMTLLPTVLTGSRALYEDTGERATEDYAYAQGKKALCIECGLHTDPQSPVVAYEASCNVMRWLGILPGEYRPNNTQKTIQFTLMKYKEKPGVFSKERTHGDILMKGESIVQYDDGTQEICEEDNTIMMLPKARAKVGGEWYFLGREV